MPRINIEGINVHYDTFGKGPNTLLLLPGLFGTIETNFGPMILVLDKEKFTIVSWDPLGYGRSYPPRKKHSKDVYFKDAEILGKMMKKLGFERYHVFGWSGGGQTALLLAGLHPDNVITCTAFAAGVVYDPKNAWLFEGFAQIENWPENQLKPLRKHLDMAYLKDIGREVRQVFLDGVKENFRYPKEWLEPVKCPTLLLHGDEDNNVDISSSHYIVSVIPSSRLHVIPKAGHYYHLMNPEEVLKVLVPFLQQHSFQLGNGV